MFWHFFAFELRYRLKRISTCLYFLIFAAFSFFAVISMGEAFPASNFAVGDGGQGLVQANSPRVLYALIVGMTFLGMLVISAIAGNAGYRDYERHRTPLYFSYPITRWGYLGGRFAGSLAVLLVVFSGVGAGAVLGSLMPFVNAAKFGPFRLMPYVVAYLIGVLPNLVFSGGIFFALALMFRRRLPVYVASIAFLVGYLIAGRLLGDLETKSLAALLEPNSLGALAVASEYWTPAEKNVLLPPLTGVLLWNRLLWTTLGLGVLGLAWRRFRFEHATLAGRARRSQGTREPGTGPAATMLAPLSLLRDFSLRQSLRQLAGLTGLEVGGIVKNVFFLAIVLFGILFTLVAGFRRLGKLYDTNTYPVTYEVLALTSGLFVLFLLIVITLYSGELVWRERDKRVQQIYGALPIADWLPYLSKFLALMFVQAMLLAVIMACGLFLQMAKGYTNFEVGLYVKELFGLRLVDCFQLCALAMLVQVLVNNKYVGHFVMVVFYILASSLERFGLEHRLYQYGSTPDTPFSDMNGYGHFLGPFSLYAVYWSALALVFVVVGQLFWVRGTESGWRERLRVARGRVRRSHLVFAGVNLAVFVAVGGFIFYNTNILNRYRTRFESDETQAAYEKLYKRHQTEPQPRITDVLVSVDIFPGERRVSARGHYRLANKTSAPINTIFVAHNDELTLRRLELDRPARQTLADAELGFHAFALDRPLAPGDSLGLEFDLLYAPRGFRNTGIETVVVENGTFVKNQFLLPSIGYQGGRELEDDDARRKHGLGPRPRMAPVDDLQARMNNDVLSDSDWVNYEATLSTTPDQIAITSGYLVREWNEGGRRYFQYKMDAPILGFFSFLSGRYEVRRDRWNDVALEIYYHRGHPYNVEQMIEALKQGLEYYTREFGPYQHRVVRIVEFPRYAQYAQAFANTIPYSESIGFVARVDQESVDYPFSVTAHELAHQWWGHQVVAGNVQGATLMSEVLSQYSALQVSRHQFGEKRTRTYLEHERHRYLEGRGSERKKEMPLYLVENQGYLHYSKGVLAMNALQDAIGEERVNRALAAFLAKHRFQQPPYVNSLELLPYLEQATPEQYAYLIQDLFKTITVWDNRALEARSVRRDDGKYDVTVKVAATKLRADGAGVESAVPIRDWIDIGVLDRDGEALYLQKHWIDKPEMEFSVTVEKEPAKAGIDPWVKLIDRKRDDNLLKIGDKRKKRATVSAG